VDHHIENATGVHFRPQLVQRESPQTLLAEVVLLVEIQQEGQVQLGDLLLTLTAHGAWWQRKQEEAGGKRKVTLPFPLLL